MGRIETDIAEIKGSIMALHSSVAQLQIGFPDAYVTRREFTEHKVEQTSQLGSMTKRTDTLDTRVWALISGMALTFLGAIVALVRTIPQIPHG